MTLFDRSKNVLDWLGCRALEVLTFSMLMLFVFVFYIFYALAWFIPRVLTICLMPVVMFWEWVAGTYVTLNSESPSWWEDV